MQGEATVVALAVLSLLVCTGVLGLYGVRVLRKGPAKFARLGAVPGSAVFPGWMVEAFYWMLAGVGRRLATLHIHPDALTWIALALSLGSAPLLALGRFPEGAICIALGGAFDALDGFVARAKGVACPGGALLDACLDRVADAAPMAGLVIYYRALPFGMSVPLSLMVAAFLASYVRARAEGLGLHPASGAMRRHERIAYTVLALVIAPLVPRVRALAGVPHPVTLAILGFVALCTWVSAGRLFVCTRAALRSGATRGRPMLPSFRRAVGLEDPR